MVKEKKEVKVKKKVEKKPEVQPATDINGHNMLMEKKTGKTNAIGEPLYEES